MNNISDASRLAASASDTCNAYMTKSNLRTLSDVCLGLGFASIALSIFTWFFRSRRDPAHGERFGIFIGLWVPSLFMLSHRLDRKAEKLPE